MKTKSFSDEDKRRNEKFQGNGRRWYNAPSDKVAAELSAYCRMLERQGERDRYLHLVFSTLATGRQPLSYGHSMNGRIHGDIATAQFSPPSENKVREALDVFANRIFKGRPFLQWTPVATDDMDVRTACENATAYVDQLWADLQTWPMVEQAGIDAGTHGSGMIFVEEIAPHKVDHSRVTVDEILVDRAQGKDPRSIQLRVFRDRFALVERFVDAGTFKKESDREILRGKLMNAPGVEQGFYNVGCEYKDQVALCYGFYKKSAITGQGGRMVLCCEDIVLIDKEWKSDEFPIAKFDFIPMADSYFGQGIPEVMLPLQREVDRIADNLAEQERRAAWIRVQVDRGSRIEDDEFEGNGIIHYSGKEAKFEQGLCPPAQLYEQSDRKSQQAMNSVGLSADQNTAEVPVESGKARLARMMIEDTRHVSVSQRFEGFVEQLGRLDIQQAGITRPEVFINGKKVDFPKIALDSKKSKMRAYPLSSLPQSIPGRLDEIERRYQDGEIDRVTKARLMDVPYDDGNVDEYTSSENLIYWQIGRILKNNKFEPPSPFCDLKRALGIAIARFNVETQRETEKSRLRKLAQYIAVVRQMVEENAPPPAAAMPLPANGGAPMVDPNLPMGLPQGAAPATSEAGAVPTVDTQLAQ